MTVRRARPARLPIGVALATAMALASGALATGALASPAVAVATAATPVTAAAVPDGARTSSIPGQAPASSTPTSSAQEARLAAIKAKADAAIAAREAILTADGSIATTAAHLSDPDRAALESLISANQSGLDQLRQTIDSDTTESQAIADAESIVTSYRIYTLVDPKVHLVVAADRGAAAVVGFASIQAELQTAIAESASAGRNVSGARASLAQLQVDVQNASAIIGQVPGQVLPLTPAGYPGNRSTLVAAAGSLVTARSDLEQAATAGQSVITDLQAG
jgi:hypothetical protein